MPPRAGEDDVRGARFAVLVPIVPRAGGEHVLLTRRPRTLRTFAGHVSLPGGRAEPRDVDLAATALRETEEEVGIAPADVEIARELPWQVTGIGHRVKPFVGRVTTGVHVRPCPREVERVLWLPVDRITGALFRQRSLFTSPDGRRHVVWTFDLDGVEVWGLTARILRSAFVEI